MSGRTAVVPPAPSLARADLIQWVAGLGAVTAEALARREGISVSSARGRLVAAVRAGQLTRHRLLTDDPALYVLTRGGIRVLGLVGFEPARVSAANAKHMVACAYAAAVLEDLYPALEVIGEPGLRRAERLAGDQLASVSLGKRGGIAARTHRPDLVLVPRLSHQGQPVAVEVELTVKAPRRLEAICRAWARARHLEGVLYLVAPDVREALKRAIDKARASEQIAIVPLESFDQDAHADR